MTDTAQEHTDTAPEDKPVKQPKQPHACLCSYFEVVDASDDSEDAFTTGCTQTTMSTFAQGHDARLISFLVDGHFDGYEIRFAKPGEVGTVKYNTPAEAAAVASESLRDKAANATAHRQNKAQAKAQRDATKAQAKAERDAIKAQAKAEREAAKAAAKPTKEPKKVGAEVVAGTSEGDQTPPADGEVKIKVGRWEYNATISEGGDATYLDGKGEEQTVNRDGYRVLETTASL